MIWSYRAVNNRIARRRWIAFALLLTALGSIYTVLRIFTTGKILQSLAIFSLYTTMIFLYTIIMLGKVRYYFIEGGEIVYKPFKTRVEEIKGYEVDERNRVIRLRLKSSRLFAVKTLYFDKDDEFQNVLKFLRRSVEGS